MIVNEVALVAVPPAVTTLIGPDAAPAGTSAVICPAVSISNPAFTPLITTPCFPGYPSAHATLSGAAREVLEQLFTRRARPLMLAHPAVPGIVLSYRKLKEITDDIDDARVYGGVHFRFEQEAGADLGRRIGEYLYKHSIVSTRSPGCEDRQAVVRGNAQ